MKSSLINLDWPDLMCLKKEAVTRKSIWHQARTLCARPITIFVHHRGSYAKTYDASDVSILTSAAQF